MLKKKKKKKKTVFEKGRFMFNIKNTVNGRYRDKIQAS